VTGYDIGLRITDHHARIEREPMLSRGLLEHARTRLPARAVGIQIVEAIVVKVDCHSHLV
jgi:hypothetical protein